MSITCASRPSVEKANDSVLSVSFFEVNVPQVRLLLIWRVSLSELWERRSEDVAEIAEMHGGTKLSNPRPPLL